MAIPTCNINPFIYDFCFIIGGIRYNDALTLVKAMQDFNLCCQTRNFRFCEGIGYIQSIQLLLNYILYPILNYTILYTLNELSRRR